MRRRKPGPNARQVSLPALRHQLSGGKPEPVYLLVGEECLLHEEALQLLRSSILDPEQEAFDLDLLQGDELDNAELATRVATYPLAAPRRLVVVRRAEALGALDESLTSGETGRGASVLVLDYSPGAAPPQKCHGTVVNLAPPSEEDIPAWVRAWFTEKGVQADAAVPEALVVAVGLSLTELRNEMEKLLLFAGETGTVGSEDVAAVVGRRAGESVYELSACVLKGQRSRAAGVLDGLGRSRGAQEMVLPQVGLDLLRLMRLKAALDEGVPSGELRQAVGVGRWWWSRWVERARQVPWEWLWSMAYLLYRTDRDVKAGGIDLGKALDVLVASVGSSDVHQQL
jgi:DNA polymerase-3 subunit delta